MADLTPEDFDYHLQRHGQQMAALHNEITNAIMLGEVAVARQVLVRHQNTLKVQARLAKLSTRISNATVPVGDSLDVAAARPAIPDVSETLPSPSLRIVHTTPHPAMNTNRKRMSYPRLSPAANRGMYLQASNYVVPIWSVISRMNRPFMLSEVRDVVAKEVFLRAADRELIYPKGKRFRRTPKERWEVMLISAFSHQVCTNRREVEAKTAPHLVRYIDAVGKNGRNVIYQLNDAGREEMRRVLSTRHIPTPDTRD